MQYDVEIVLHDSMAFFLFTITTVLQEESRL
jgi:hypothetical protein